MKNTSRILAMTALSVLAATLSPVQSPAQTKQETKLYARTVKSPSRAAYEKFLAKMPQSVYADEIRARLDTLLNISPYSIEDARKIAAEVLGLEEAESAANIQKPGGTESTANIRKLGGTESTANVPEPGGPESSAGAEFFAFAQRKDGTDRILSMVLGSGGSCRFATMEPDGKGGETVSGAAWKIVADWKMDADSESAEKLTLTDGGSFVEVAGEKKFLCGALFAAAGLEAAASSEGQLRYSQWLLDAFAETHPRVDFLGTDILRKGDALPFRLEGRVNTMALDAKDRGSAWLQANMAGDPRLVELPFAVVQSDEAIRWWRKENAGTAKTGGTLKFCELPEGCSLIGEFAKSKYRARSAKYVAAMFDCRGWTVIVSQNRETGAYNLAWAEPECRDHARDVLLNGISFRSSTTLEMQYFHGKKYYKRMLNLASMNLN